jgi:uncharacterized caspase-like protein
LVKIWRGDLKLDSNGKATLEASIRVVAGPNRLTAYAFNNDNIKSSDAELLLNGGSGLKRKGTAYVLVFGVNQYENSDFNLKFAVADAQSMAEELGTQQIKLGTWSSVTVVPLLDANATKANFALALQKLAGEAVTMPSNAPSSLDRLKPAQPEDAIFIYFAGHGAVLGARYYLIPYDLGYLGKRADLDEAAARSIQAHSISDVELEAMLEKVDAGDILLIIDACQSGQVLETQEKRRGPMNSKGLSQLAYEKGMYVLAASQGYQAALEVEQLGHGLLTYALVEEGLKTDVADNAPKDGQVVAREWLDYAVLRVPQLEETQIEAAHKDGRELFFVDEDRGASLGPQLRGLQRPRVFYRREQEAQGFLITRVAGD